MPIKKKRTLAVTVLLALCLLCGTIGGCGGSAPAPSAEETETSSVSEGTAPGESVPEETAPEESIPDASAPDVSTPDVSVPDAPAPDVDAPYVDPGTIDTDDPETLALLAQIVALAEEYALSVSYLSGDGAYAFSVNGSEVYASASTIKAMYCEYLLESGLDWQAEILFTAEEVSYSASEQLTEERLGTTFPLGDLVDYTLRYSDNMAYGLLYSTFGNEHYNAWVRALGIPGLRIHGESGYTNVCADDLSRGMLEIYRHGLTDDRVIKSLMRARFRSRISAGTPYAVACKFGLKSDRTGYHETAIVYAPEPYVLTILSCLNPDNPEEAEPFIEMAGLTDRLNERLTQSGSNATP